MLLVSGKTYAGKYQSSVTKQEVLCITTLNGGTANFYVKDVDSASWVLVTALDDVPVTVRVPFSGFYKVETTGAATVYGEWS